VFYFPLFLFLPVLVWGIEKCDFSLFDFGKYRSLSLFGKCPENIKRRERQRRWDYEFRIAKYFLRDPSINDSFHETVLFLISNGNFQIVRASKSSHLRDK
jgi:hypothetical protein